MFQSFFMKRGGIKMAEKKTTSEVKTPGQNPPKVEEEVPRKPRRHGYRGYPLSKEAGGVHWGRGFSGVGALGGEAGSALPRAGIFTEESTKTTSKP
jgi:hypothetical protein